MEAMCGLQRSDAFSLFHRLRFFFELAEVEVCLAWAAAVLVAAIVVAKAVKKAALDARTGGGSASQHMVLDDGDDWSSCSSDEDSEEEYLETENEDESAVDDGTEDDCWGWSWSNFWETGRDNVVRSWEEDGSGRAGGVGLVGSEEPKPLVPLWVRRRDEVVQRFENPLTGLRDGGQLLRRRVVGLGARGEEKLWWRLRNGYAADLPNSTGRVSVSSAEDGRLEAAVVAWYRNAASCLPLLSPDKS